MPSIVATYSNKEKIIAGNPFRRKIFLWKSSTKIERISDGNKKEMSSVIYLVEWSDWSMLSLPTDVPKFQTRRDCCHFSFSFSASIDRIEHFLLVNSFCLQCVQRTTMLASFRKQDKKDEESATSGNPYRNLEKASVLQEVDPLLRLPFTCSSRSVSFDLGSYLQWNTSQCKEMYSDSNKNYLHDQSGNKQM